MCISVNACRDCGKTSDLNDYFICQMCFNKLTEAKKNKYIHECNPNWSKVIKSKSIETYENKSKYEQSRYY